jgi:hypothetical protein
LIASATEGAQRETGVSESLDPNRCLSPWREAAVSDRSRAACRRDFDRLVVTHQRGHP